MGHSPGSAGGALGNGRGLCPRTHRLLLGRKGTDLLIFAQITNKYFKEYPGPGLAKTILKQIVQGFV